MGPSAYPGSIDSKQEGKTKVIRERIAAGRKKKYFSALNSRHWRQELQAELGLNINFTHQLETSRKNLEKALIETEGPMKVNSECIYNR